VFDAPLVQLASCFADSSILKMEAICCSESTAVSDVHGATTEKAACFRYSNSYPLLQSDVSSTNSTQTNLWTFGIQLWGTASTSNIEFLEHFHSKALRMIVDAPWYVPNTVIRRDRHTPTVTGEIHRYSSQYSARLSAHPNGPVVNLMEQPDNRRLRRHLPNDLPTRFLV
jgi:hypothetical protein